ncbi:dihydrouridine(20/20a) synthase [Seminavis robusta]|uniref:Dihydrouridine(20/20a) synthase n=1 Tax=Seminavis robusta TaxID=568900 RepID=A0A9N8F3R9_9STRA|nr:dihydrouridine(20/20a) synthase [Seminavis robusta]|eukprot:Sro3076_g343310.1 dihydrouridine(20/20a) synthase (492) ;mRNA; f:1604-3163
MSDSTTDVPAHVDETPLPLDTTSAITTTTTATSASRQKSLHIAPMLHVSTTEFRNFLRILTKQAVLWNEMVVDETICFNPEQRDHHLGMTSREAPVVCQIGGIDTKYTAAATRIILNDYSEYSEINLNMDCPSSRVSGRKFGAILMKDVDTAVEILRTMQQEISSTINTKIQVSVKCRVGIDELDSMEFMVELITKLSQVTSRFYLHARKCLLEGLSPKENRLVPPLNYPRVYELCRRFPQCEFYINGGIPGLQACKELLYGVPPSDNNNNNQHQVPCSICNVPNGSCTAPPNQVPPNLMGCMLGRAAMDHPAQFWDVDRYLYGCPSNPCPNRRQLLESYCQYLERVYPRRCCDDDDRVTMRIPSPPNLVHHSPWCPHYKENSKCHGNNSNKSSNKSKTKTTTIKISSCVMDRCFKPVYGVFFGIPGSRTFRRAIDVNSRDQKRRNCGPAFLLRKAMQVMPSELLDQPFCDTEELGDSIPVHVSPPAPCSC